MPNRRLLLTPAEFAGESIVLSGERAHRLFGVLRLRAGAPLAVFDGLGHERAATLRHAERARVDLLLGEPLVPLAEPRLPLVLCCAFPRGARGDWLIEKATELGASAFVPLGSDRGVLRAGDGRIERWRRIAREAAEQSGRAVVPTFEVAPPPGALTLVADLDAALSPTEVLASTPRCDAVALYVGPEGGWTARERAAHVAAGYRLVRLGPRPLRVETAALVLLTLALEATGAD